MLLGCTSKTKCLRTYIDTNFFPCLDVENSLLQFVQTCQIQPSYLYISVKIKSGILIWQQIKLIYLLCGLVRDVIYYRLPLLQSGCYTDSVKLLVSTLEVLCSYVYTVKNLRGNSMKVSLKHEYTKFSFQRDETLEYGNVI